MNDQSEIASSGESAAVYCANLVRERDFQRYAVTLFGPEDKRRALLALFAFNVEIVRIRDHITQPLPGEMRLQWWSDMIAGTQSSNAEGNPVASELMRAIAAHDLPREKLLQMIEAHIFDVYNDPMPTLDALEVYCHDTSSILFSLSARIFSGESPEADHVARHAGIAQGISDVIACLPVHAARGQLFLPHTMLAENGVNESDIFAGIMTPALHEVIERLRAEGVSHLDSAGELLASVPEGAQPAFLRLALIRRILTHVTPANADAFKPPSSSRLAILWTLWKASRSQLFRS